MAFDLYCFQGLGWAALGKGSLIKKRLRPIHTTGWPLPRALGKGSLIKKRLRP